MNNLQFYDGKWFVTYKGFIYANKPLDVHTRIYNKTVIDRQLAKNPNRTVLILQHDMRRTK